MKNVGPGNSIYYYVYYKVNGAAARANNIGGDMAIVCYLYSI